MSEILSDAFSVSWDAYGYLTKVSQLDILKISKSRETVHIPIVIGCVDNHACRLLLEQFFEEQENCIYLDSANEYRCGEAVFAYRINGKTVSPVRSTYFPELKKQEHKARTELSCEELNNVAPQHISTNMLAGFVLFSEFCSLLNNTPHGGMVCFDSMNYTMDYIPYNQSCESTGPAL